MVTPKEIFEEPDSHFDLLTATQDHRCEGQFLDRKEVPHADGNGIVQQRAMDKFAAQVIETISAFANANKEGGILVIGISKSGQILGVDHLSEAQRHRLTNFHGRLRNEYCQVKSHAFEHLGSPTSHVLLVFVPHTANAICETADTTRKAWIRRDLQNVVLDPEARETLKRQKGITDFEFAACLPFDSSEIDQDVLQQFKASFLEGTAYDYDPPELLKKAGGATQDHQKRLWMTNAGLLFFGGNPQQRFPGAYLRVMKFDSASNDIDAPRLPSFERDFTGPLTEQIRGFRAFLKGSAFLKAYQRRNPVGGFIEEPEIPFLAVDEALVNAVAHRDYGVNSPIQVKLYRDALTVKNPGRVVQVGHDLPDTFTLDQTQLEHAPRNARILEWLRKMRDINGNAFVQLLSEGTRTMAREMHKLGLPAPEFRLTDFDSTLVLYSNAEAREARYKQEAIAATEFANCYPLRFEPPLATGLDTNQKWDWNQLIFLGLLNRLKHAGWVIDSRRFGRLTVHQRGASIPIPGGADRFVRLFPAYVLQLKEFWGRLYLCVDYDVQVRNFQNCRQLLQQIDTSEIRNRRSVVKIDGWQDARILEADVERSKVLLLDSGREAEVASNQVIPSLPAFFIQNLMYRAGVHIDLHRLIKESSLSLKPQAARLRADKTNSVVQQLAREPFPLKLQDRLLILEPSPLMIPRYTERMGSPVLRTLEEPTVRFDHEQETRNIRDGITKFGAYETGPKTIELVPVCPTSARQAMSTLIERLKAGSFAYKGSERTFKTRLTYNSIVTAPTEEAVISEIERLLREHPEWEGTPNLDRLFLIYASTLKYSSDNENSPYYRAKHLLLEAGIPSQMVNQPTLDNPDWKDLNLALNIVAKCGVTPWVLPDAIPDTDFFVGLSYTENGLRGQEKYLGYANVFNQFGRWEFYSGSGDTFPYAERAQHFSTLVKMTLQRLSAAHSLQQKPNIAFHYSAKFSREDRAAILAGARTVRPDGNYTFVWINTHHIVRFYDQRPETDGSLARGGFVVTSPTQLYISTTGFNPYRKTLGTPVVLEANVHIDAPEGMRQPAVDHKSIANQILSLTKLNWASTDSLCGEPITTKYAGDIAYLTAAFLRQEPSFKLHRALEQTPWFI